MVSGITIVLTSQHSHTTYTTANSYLATPVWVGLAIAVTGVVGMCAAKKSSLYLVCMLISRRILHVYHDNYH